MQSHQKILQLQLERDLLVFEKRAFARGFSCIAGIDEAGRGPLAGPVVAVACSIAEGLIFPGINDSKLLSESARNHFFSILSSHPEVAFGVGCVDSETIDRINILEATKLAMKEAIEGLKRSPDYLLVDAVKLSYKKIPCESIIQGDRKSQSIAAASILAKVTRDEKMKGYHQQYPQYGFNDHKGYGTKRHLNAIATHGPCPLHRLSFRPLKHE